jgi:hypothetical protein
MMAEDYSQKLQLQMITHEYHEEEEDQKDEETSDNKQSKS